MTRNTIEVSDGGAPGMSRVRFIFADVNGEGEISSQVVDDLRAAEIVWEALTGERFHMDECRWCRLSSKVGRWWFLYRKQRLLRKEN